MICQLFINLTEWGKRQVICWQLIGNIKHEKNYCKFTQSCTVTAFLRAGNRCKNLQLI